MIRILPLKDEKILKELNQKENTKASLCFCMYESEEIGGYILYNLNENMGTIQAINSPNDMITDGLVRAVFASLYDFGINSAIFNEALDNECLSRLNFVKTGEYKTNSIKSILYACKNCKK